MRAVVGVVFAAACASSVDVPPPIGIGTDDAPTDEAGQPLPSAGTATLRAGTIVLPPSMTKDAVVGLGEVVFPAAGNEALLDLVRGNVIVSGTGDGFLRRVYSVTGLGDTIRVITSPATLADAVTDAAFHMTVTDSITFEQRIDANVNLLSATITGGITFQPTIDVDFVVEGDALTSFDLQVIGMGNTKVEGALAFENPNHWAWGEEKPVDQLLFRRAFALGNLPIVVVGRASANLAATAYVEEPVRFSVGAAAQLAVDAQSSYTPATGWTSSDASTYAITQIGPVHDGPGRASLAVGIDPRIELQFYGVGGPQLQLAAQAGGFGAYCGSSLLVGLQAAMRGAAAMRLEALVKLPSANVTFFESVQTLDELEQCAP